MGKLSETIAAISTPLGEGGISVIRISGKDAFRITGKLFSKTKEGTTGLDFSEVQSHTIHFGYLISDGLVIDEVLISVFKNPNSYTGEDVIEISSHGGVLVTQKVLSAVIRSGAIHAEPGEFTKRAFLNGRIDLSQAEAVADLIKAKTDEAHNSSIKQLEGSLSGFINGIREEIIKVTALVELELDFAEEDVEFTKKDELRNKCREIIHNLVEIISSYISGKVIRDGVNVVIAGKPNSGKSSLFNALLKSDRAIVSDISGTTRDYLEESFIIDGILFNLTDTAGLRLTEDIIETEGIKRANEKIRNADLVIYLIDSSGGKNELDSGLKYFNENLNTKNSIPVFTKSDISSAEFKKLNYKEKILAINLNDQKTLSFLKKGMVDRVSSSVPVVQSGKIILTNLRHKICLEETVASLKNVIISIEKNMSGEFISVDLRNAMKHLGEITGEVTNDEILNYIFSKFCIGK
ncbi:MAG: tRNA uridine-5-carboxymethylaminomethyl(34) synthesis GTPase MnmE [Ignavibacteria bacterium]|nr:tRNA uridine-5-carboxymethylaminomethyl(34) synthesis GTPase MnmE [Ignavibacteria bacterium]